MNNIRLLAYFLFAFGVFFFFVDAFNKRISVKFDSLAWGCLALAFGLSRL